MQAGNGTVNEHSQFLVVLRIRPPTNEGSESLSVRPLGNQHLVLTGPQPNSSRFMSHEYEFDAVLGPETTQSEVFEVSARPLVQAALQGVSSAVFVYGAADTGKTFTMQGTPDLPGLVPQVLREVFEASPAVSVKLSHFQLSNETLYDLLADNSRVLDVYEDQAQGVFVSGLSEYPVNSFDQALEIYRRSATKQTTQDKLQPRQSHTFLQVRLEHVTDHGVTSSKLLLIDLAGSERIDRTRNERPAEGASAMRALLALGNCITALSARRNTHVPYRESKLTRLLKASLSGSWRSTMIACVSPCGDRFDEAQHTLEYARRAKAIKNRQPKDSRSGNAVASVQCKLDVLKQQLHAPASVNAQLKRIKGHFDEELRLTQNSGMSKSASLQQLMTLRAKRGQLLLRPVPEQYKAHLELAVGVGEHKVETLTHHQRREQAEALLKRHDQMLWVLSEQLKARDKVIEVATQAIQQRSESLPNSVCLNLKNIRSTRDLLKQAELPLSAKPTHIPQKGSLHNLRLTMPLAASEGKIPRVGRSTLFRTVYDNAASANSRKVSEKFTKSPYVQNMSRCFNDFRYACLNNGR